MPKKTSSRTVEDIINSKMEKQQRKEELLQQRILEKELKQQLALEKLEQKKQDLIDRQNRREEQKDFKLQTKIELHEERSQRKNSNMQVNQLNKSNNKFSSHLTHIQNALDNNILKLDRTNKQFENTIDQKHDIYNEIQRIEEERRKEVEDNQIMQSILLEKKTTIQNALDELNDLNIKTNTEYDKIQDNKNIEKFEISRAELKLALLRKNT
tara:strand:+ start:7759 stop:8394 length:636 start_codon:yes stop_codon:yes gene_type:complete